MCGRVDWEQYVAANDKIKENKEMNKHRRQLHIEEIHRLRTVILQKI